MDTPCQRRLSPAEKRSKVEFSGLWVVAWERVGSCFSVSVLHHHHHHHHYQHRQTPPNTVVVSTTARLLLHRSIAVIHAVATAAVQVGLHLSQTAEAWLRGRPFFRFQHHGTKIGDLEWPWTAKWPFFSVILPTLVVSWAHCVKVVDKAITMGNLRLLSTS